MVLMQLIILFTVIIDPLASFGVFFSAVKGMNKKDKRKIANLAVSVAAALSFSVLFLGNNLLHLFSTSIEEFRIAGGIILAVLGVKMSLGHSPAENVKGDSAKAIAAIIGTPLLTGPATITAIIVSVNDYGVVLTGTAVTLVLIGTAALFYQADKIKNFFGDTFVRIVSTILGMVTLAWGIRFASEGIKAIFF
jgi:multiple antibiotic resistance protein